MSRKRKLKIAVRELVSYVLRSGDLDLTFRISVPSTEGIKAHQKLQQDRPDNYSPEVAVSYQIETDKFIIDIGGRIDGVYCFPPNQSKPSIIIEEIKSTHRDLSYYDEVENPIHWGQVKTYAYIYAANENLDRIGIRIIYYHIESGDIREYHRDFSYDELKNDFDRLIARYLKWAEKISEWGEIRDASANDLAFPFVAYRPGQRKMAVEAFKAIKSRDQLLVQAATGIGKTMSVIFPAVKAFAEDLHDKTFYLTARTTGRTVAEKAFKALSLKGLRMKTLTLTAKDKICYNPECLCTPEECEFAKGYYDRIDSALNALFAHDAFTRGKIEQIGRDFTVCPFELSLDLSLWVDFIICDYNYAFDPRVYLRRFFAEGHGEYTFLIDEAHNLVDRSRNMFSAELSKQVFLDIRRALKSDLPHIYKHMGSINSWLLKARKAFEEGEEKRSDKALPESLLPKLFRFIKDVERWLSKNIPAKYREDLLNIYFDVTAFVRVAEQFNQRYVTCYEKLGKDLRIKLFCMDPSEQLEVALQRCRSAVFFSATMTPTDYFQNILGCKGSAGRLILPSPFPKENLKVFVANRVSTYYRQRDKTKDTVVRAALKLVGSSKGNYILYFPSYAYMRMIYDLFKEMDPEIRTIIQTPDMTESEREGFLDCFSHENPETLVGFAVMGGIFGEGIDLVGDRLSGAAIVGVGLPGISLENDLIRDYFSRTDGTGFEYAYLYPGINRVLQAAGRVIRTHADRGIVLLVDQRFASMRYRSLLPQTWRPLMADNEEKLADELQRFWHQRQ